MTTGWSVTSLRISSLMERGMVRTPSSALGRAKGESMEVSAQHVAKRGLNHAMLLEKALSGEQRRDDHDLVVVSSPCHVPDAHLASRQGGFDAPADLARLDHR